MWLRASKFEDTCVIKIVRKNKVNSYWRKLLPSEFWVSCALETVIFPRQQWYLHTEELLSPGSCWEVWVIFVKHLTLRLSLYHMMPFFPRLFQWSVFPDLLSDKFPWRFLEYHFSKFKIHERKDFQLNETVLLKLFHQLLIGCTTFSL